MSQHYLKRATKTPETEAGDARKVVAEMLADVEKRGEAAVREYAQKLDRWRGEIVVTPEEVERRTRDISAGIKRDIEFATERVRRFAKAQLKSISEFQTEIVPGLVAGQRLVPVIEAARMLGASNLRIVAEVLFPSAIPSIVAGLRVSAGLGWQSLIGAELIVASSGIGYLMVKGQSNISTAIVMSGMIAIGLVGAAIDVLLRGLQARIERHRAA